MRRKTIPYSARRAKYLDWIFLVPASGPYDARYFHADISEMNKAQQRRELERARHRILQDPGPHPWLLDRFDILTEGLESNAD
jgi:hypothetical protein